jgi:preprotein translocase subunit SecD
MVSPRAGGRMMEIMTKISRTGGVLLALIMAQSLAAQEDVLVLPVERATVSVDSATGDPLLLIWLSRRGRDGFTDFSNQHIGSRVDVMVDGEVLTSPFIQSPIQSELLMISGGFTQEEAEILAKKLTAEDGGIGVRPFAP